jgi:flagellar biosynthesis GTPase FlhF
MGMSTALTLLSDYHVRSLIASGTYEKSYILTRLLTYADAADAMLEPLPSDVANMVLGWLPQDFVRNALSASTAESRVGYLIAQATDCLICLEDCRCALNEQHEREANERAAHEAELARQAEEAARIEREAQEAADRRLEEAKAAQVEERKRLAREAAERAKRIADQEAAHRRRAQEELKRSDDVIASSEPSEFVGEFVGYSEAEAHAMPIEKSGLPVGVVNTLAKMNLKTVGQLILYGETASFTSIAGIGESSAQRIKARIDEIVSSIRTSGDA